MKKLLALAGLFVTFSCNAYAFGTGGGGGPSPVIPCTASPPSQASSVGLTNLVGCDTFADMRNIDVYNTQQSGYHWYPGSAFNTRPLTPPGNFSTDGTGIGIQSGGAPTANNGQVLQTAGRKSTSPNWVGTVYTGSFYVEIDMKFNPTLPSGQGGSNSPSFWLNSNTHNAHSCDCVSTDYPYIEVDIDETIGAGNGEGGSTGPFMGVHEWFYNNGNGGQTLCGTNGYYPNPTIDATTYNKAGFLFLASTDNGGTGLMKWYYNDVLQMTCTYSASGLPQCDRGGITGSGCAVGGWMEFDTQPHPFIIGGGYPPWTNTVRNFHVWQKP